jgi:glucosamine--fructose-6-phosphate aminotransferase (isomerizing)
MGVLDEMDRQVEGVVASMKRCIRCVLPATAPFIELDAQGVCRHCRNHSVVPLAGEGALRLLADSLRRTDGKPDCMVALSGGRDSCYVLHHVCTELKLRPVAFTYDWGLVTPLGKRNQVRMTQALGVPRVDHEDKVVTRRADVRANVLAWLKRPELGMVPLIMAGDKPFFFQAWKVKRRLDVKALFFGMAEDYENEDFKEGFGGARTEGRKADKHSYQPSLAQKLQVFKFFGRNFLLNPSYLNRSLPRTAFGAFSYYVLPHDYFTNLFSFVEWNEETVVGTLRSRYGWESTRDNASTWRTGDAASAFINHIYLCTAGFTENDFLRSNQVRRGVISRERALELVKAENRVHADSVLEFLSLVGLEPDPVLRRIREVPTRYR